MVKHLVNHLVKCVQPALRGVLRQGTIQIHVYLYLLPSIGCQSTVDNHAPLEHFLWISTSIVTPVIVIVIIVDCHIDKAIKMLTDTEVSVTA